jgi:O-antigen ligase/tetratricopeptide (TPR) repeat protein
VQYLSPNSSFARITDRLQDLCLVAILLAAPLVFYTHGYDVFESNKIMAVRVLACLAAFAFAARLLLVRPLKLVRSPLDFPLLAFLAVSLVCTFHTKNIYLSVHGVFEDFEGITTLLLYFFLAWWVQQHVRSSRQVHLFVGSVILAGTLAGFYGILQNFQIDFVPWNPATYSKNRLFATLGNPNFLAAYLVMSLPLCLVVFLDLPERIKTDRKLCLALCGLGLIASIFLVFLFNIDYFNLTPAAYDSTTTAGMWTSQKFIAAHLLVFFPLAAAILLYYGRLKLIFLISMLFQLVAIAYTKSRGGTLALAGSMAVLGAMFLWEWRRGTELFRRNRGWLGGLLGAAVAVVLFYGPIRQTTLETLQRLGALANPTHLTLTPRLYIWRSALQILRDNFWFGTGLDTFQIVFPHYRTALYWILEWNGTPEKAHNVILQTAATMGMAGLLAFFWILVAYTAKTWRLLKLAPDSTGRLLMAGCFAAALAFLIQDCFSFTVIGYGSLFWMLTGLAGAQEEVWKTERTEPSGASISSGKAPAWALPLLILAGLSLFWYALYSEKTWIADSFYKQGSIGMQAGQPGYALRMQMKAAGRLAGIDEAELKRILSPEPGEPQVPVEKGLYPEQELYWVKMGIAYEAAAAAQTDPQMKEKAWLTALAIHQHTLEMNPINGYNYNNKGRVLKDMGEALNRADYLEDAARHYDKAMELDPNNVYFALDQAQTQLALGRPPKMAEICESLTKRFPDFALPYYYLGFLASRAGHGADGIALLSQSLKKDWKGDPQAAGQAANLLGQLEQAAGHRDQAIEAYKQSLGLNPSAPSVYQSLGRLLMAAGRKQEAVQVYRALLAVSRDDKEALDALKKLGD